MSKRELPFFETFTSAICSGRRWPGTIDIISRSLSVRINLKDSELKKETLRESLNISLKGNIVFRIVSPFHLPLIASTRVGVKKRERKGT